MNWEIVNGITGVISAIAAVVSIGYFGTHKPSKNSVASPPILNPYKLASFVVACSGWALCCLAYLWVFEPFGIRPSPREYQQFFGVILSFPAIVIFMFGVNLLQGNSDDTEEEPN